MIIYECKECGNEFSDDTAYNKCDCPFCGNTILTLTGYDTDTIDTLDDERTLTLKELP